MWYVVLKTLISAVLITLISEIGKRSSFWGGILASLPLTSLLAILWLYRDTHDVQKIASLSTSIFWFVLPSLAFFLIFPYLLKHKMAISLALILSAGATVCLYYLMVMILKRYGVQLCFR